ncbi:MAG: sigma-70 family RNA polymerase sigma factor, partial [Anaerolineales bacterium]|nr:sigma-70 family RNA polymerase sigma factor [Anaerolineales bacterium]
MTERSDQQWISQLKQEDEAAILDLWQMLFQFAVSAARKYRQSNDTGRDAAAAAYRRIRQRGIYQYRFACPFPGYCRQIVVREVLRRIPKNDPYLVDIDTVYSTAVAERDPLPKAEQETVQARLEPCLENLNGREREIIDLLYFEEM